jgi:hypothetical protein
MGKTSCRLRSVAFAAAFAAPAEDATNSPAGGQSWNWHVQNTDIVQGYPGFSSKYSGPNSLPAGGQTLKSVSLDLMAGVLFQRATPLGILTGADVCEHFPAASALDAAQESF